MGSLPILAAWSMVAALLGAPGEGEGDWPQWRHDASRSACSPAGLVADLHLHWVLELPPPRPAWPDQPRMEFDAAPRPVVAGSTLFLGLPGRDAVAAFDTRTGAEQWRVYTDGPVRLPPAVWKDLVLAASDDGFLYCFEASTGAIRWRFRGGPEDRRVLGNGRLISAWPARGGPVVADGIVYFAAGIWPFMGISLHALEAGTGRVIWSNEGDGSLFTLQPHRAEAFGGVAPQGSLAVAGGRLLVPGGRSVPACYDRATGRLVHYRPADAPRKGGSEVVPAGGIYVVDGAVFDLESGLEVGELGAAPVVEKGSWRWAGRDCDVLSMAPPTVETVEMEDRRGRKAKRLVWRKTAVTRFPSPQARVLIRAGDRVYGGGDGAVWALDLSSRRVAWSAPLEGSVLDLAAADGRLFASTREGRIYCFGPGPREPLELGRRPAISGGEDRGIAEARAVLDRAGVREGYALVWGLGEGRLVEGLLEHSALHVVAVDPDDRRVEGARRRLDAAGFYGERAAVHVGDPFRFSFPPYMASLVVITEGAHLEREGAERLWEVLRPFGGMACLPAGAARAEDLFAWLPEAEVRESGGSILVSRPGAPPGSGDWTHEHADAANTRVSRDRRVRAPLEILWFGGSSHEGILPRHGHGPQPQAVEGRIFIEGMDMIRAMDLYTGRVLWEARIPGVGAFFDNVLHQPGANASGSNFVSLPDGIYVACGRSCRRLDPGTGRTVSEFRLPPAPGTSEAPVWGYLNVIDDVLVGGAEPLAGRRTVPADPRAGDDDPDEDRPKTGSPPTRGGFDPDAFSSSRRLVAMDREDGRVLWSLESRLGFRHNGICAGGGRLYCLDRLSGLQAERLKSQGKEPPAAPRLAAFDLRTGRELWRVEREVFGTWLSYSAAHDVLVESGRVARDTIGDEPRGMRAYRASNGEVLWTRRDYAGPAMIHGDTILMDGAACDLRTGEPRVRFHPLTGLPGVWTWRRAYGCNTPAASANLLTFRSGAAGYFDLERDGGTGNFGGFRSGCSHNLVVAGGVLCAPDYTRTCLCSYSNQTSLALVPAPGAEMWTYFGSSEVRGAIRRVGLNLGAPGDRRAEDGTLWIEHPPVAGRSPSVPVRTGPSGAEVFRLHPAGVAGGGIPWVAASGIRGLRSLAVTLDREGKRERRYDVRLYFLEPEDASAGERRFHVSIQGRRVLEGFDVVREAGGPRRGVVREFAGIVVRKDLVVELEPAGRREPLLCGLEAWTDFEQPRYRYALERWPADPYEVEAVVGGGLAEADRQVLETLERAAGRANLEVRFRRAGVTAGAGTRLILREPVAGGGGGRVLWSGPLTAESAERLLDSPVRRELARRLLSGEGPVWIFLEGGHGERDEAAVARLEAAIRRAVEHLGPAAPASSVIRVSRGDPGEDLLIRMLEAIDPLPAGGTAPAAYPVFGRGRVLGRVSLEGSGGEAVEDLCAYVAEGHRGESKRAAPGGDLLLMVPWGDRFPSRVPPEVLLTPLWAKAPPGEEEGREGEDRGEDPGGGGTVLAWSLATVAAAATVLFVVLRFWRRG